MKAIGLLEFRKNAETIIRRASRGEKVVLSYRGKPVVQLLPYQEDQVNPDDPFYSLAAHAEAGGNLTNREIDRLLNEA